MPKMKLTQAERKKRRYESQERYRHRVLRFTLQFNVTTDTEAREWFEFNGKSGTYLKRLILEDKQRFLREQSSDAAQE